MSRNGSGTEVVPNTFTVGTPITASQHNENWADMAAEMTNSLPRDGQAGMIGQFKAASGSLAAPSISFTSAATSGIYKTASGYAFSVGGVWVGEFTSTGLSVTSISTTGIVGLVQVGAGMDWWLTTAPAGWYFAYGQQCTTATPILRQAWIDIGSPYGSAGGNPLFPDKRNLASYGKGDMGGVDRGLITTAGAGVNGAVLGAAGGAQSVALTQANLPNITLTTALAAGQGVHGHGLHKNTGVPTTETGGTIPYGGGGNAGPDNISMDAATLPAMSGTTPLGGSGTAINKLSPGIVCNYIIFAGA